METETLDLHPELQKAFDRYENAIAWGDGITFAWHMVVKTLNKHYILRKEEECQNLESR